MLTKEQLEEVELYARGVLNYLIAMKQAGNLNDLASMCYLNAQLQQRLHKLNWWSKHIDKKIKDELLNMGKHLHTSSNPMA